MVVGFFERDVSLSGEEQVRVQRTEEQVGDKKLKNEHRGDGVQAIPEKT